MAADRYLLGFDIGGTFTDFVLLNADSGEMHIHKCLTTPRDPAQGTLDGIQELLTRVGLSISDVAVAIHGTTLVTNALIERRGAHTGFLTTRGFRDIMEMGKEQRYDIYDLFLQFPAPLVARRDRREIAERIDREGRVLLPLNPEEVKAEVSALVSEGIQALAIAFLHSYANSAHEEQARDIVAANWPNLPVSISSEVVPEIREFERSVTTAANAYVQPMTQVYVERLESALKDTGFKGQFFLMQSAGGTAITEIARTLPIRLLESGPAAGAIAAAFFGKMIDRPDLLSFDMGGTTAKACVVEGGRPAVSPEMEAARMHRFKKGSGLPIKTPVVDLIEIGAGGGSLARVDQMGLLKVGPKSAGAEPGPACYGLGGEEPTVTDANLVLGYLNPDYFLGGRIKLDIEAARRALAKVGEPLNLDATAVAWGIHHIVTENMAAAARVHIVEKGRDPRRLSMVAFGGAGPAHACRLARTLGMSEAIVPVAAGATSALGFLVAPISFDFSRSYPVLLNDVNWDHLNELLTGMEERGRRLLHAAGINDDQMVVERMADMRLLGQVHSITSPIPLGTLTEGHRKGLAEQFAATYRRLYRHWFEGNPILALTWRVTVKGPESTLTFRANSTAAVAGATTGGSQALKGVRQAYFPEAGGYVETKIYDRYALVGGDQVIGPAVVEERESTVVIGPGDLASIDSFGNLMVKLASGSSAAPRTAVADPGIRA